MCCDFCLSRPASSGGLVWLDATWARLSPRGADRSYCRTGGALVGSTLPRRQVSPPAGIGESGVCESLPRSELGTPRPQAPLPARTFKTTLERPSCGRGWPEVTIARSTGDKFFCKLFFC